MKSDEDASVSELEDTITTELEEEIEQNKPDADECAELIREHVHHLVRRTQSKTTIEKDTPVEVPDMYCFTCGAWVGLSGVNLNGTPRSKREAFYLDGPPDAVAEIEETVDEAIIELASSVRNELPRMDSIEEAVGFIGDEIERIQDAVEELDEGEPGEDELSSRSSDRQ